MAKQRPARSSEDRITARRTRSPGRGKTSKSAPSGENKPRAASTPKTGLISPKARSPMRSKRSPTRGSKQSDKQDEVRRRKASSEGIRLDSDSGSESDNTKNKNRKSPKKNIEKSIEKILSPPKNPSGLRRTSRQTNAVYASRDLRTKFSTHYSDEDDFRGNDTANKSKSKKLPTEFGGWLGSLVIMFSFIGFILYFYTFCSAKFCRFGTFYPTKLSFDIKSVLYFYNLKAYLIYFAYAVLVGILTLLPIGKKIESSSTSKGGAFVYVANGLIITVTLLAIVIAVELKHVFPIADYILNHFNHFLTASILFGCILIAFAFIRSFYVSFNQLNAHALQRGRIYEFFMGREINPRLFGKLDLKWYLLKFAIIGAILLDYAYFYRHATLVLSSPTNTWQNLNSTLITLLVLHSIYYFDALIFEYTWPTTFEVKQEGFGFSSTIGYVLYPFIQVAGTKFLFDFGIYLPVWRLALSSVIFLAGYILYRGSNNQKDAFRKNPYDPSLSHLKTIPTGQAKKLLCSGFWGFVRHPNYLGDILMLLSFATFVEKSPPMLMMLLLIFGLIHRTVRDHYRCKERYGGAWDRYCQAVKYVLIPKVY